MEDVARKCERYCLDQEFWEWLLGLEERHLKTQEQQVTLVDRAVDAMK